MTEYKAYKDLSTLCYTEYTVKTIQSYNQGEMQGLQQVCDLNSLTLTSRLTLETLCT